MSELLLVVGFVAVVAGVAWVALRAPQYWERRAQRRKSVFPPREVNWRPAPAPTRPEDLSWGWTNDHEPGEPR